MNKMNKVYAGLLCLGMAGCAKAKVPEHPAPCFDIKNYTVKIDEKPGEYYRIEINGNKYCYYYKGLLNGHELFITDRNCDRRGEEVTVISGSQIQAYSQYKELKPEARGNLDAMLRDGEKK